MSIAGTYTLTIGDTLEPLNAVLRDGNGNPYDLANYTVKCVLETDAGAEELAETDTGVTKHPTQVFTLDSTNNWIACNAHGYKTGDVWVPATTGSLSGTGITAGTRYKVVETDVDMFRVSVQNGGGRVTIAGAGTGTHTGYVVGSVQMDFAAANVDTAGNYRLWFVLLVGSEKMHRPPGKDNYIQVLIETRGN